MKIPATTNPHPRGTAPADVSKPSARRNSAAGEAAAADDPVESNAAHEGRDFASVLEEVSRPRGEQRRESEGDGEQPDSQARDRAEGEQEARRRDERQQGDSGGGDSRGGFDQRAGVRDAAATQEAAARARAILHIADLERIVSAVRAQTLAGGVREITIELRRSVLEGLRIKLGLDGAGRVAAEFVASSERARAQIDARASELGDLLRSRGVQLSALRTSVGADASGGDDSRREGGRGRVEHADAAARLDAPEPQTADDGATGRGEAGDGTTYRA